MLYESLAAAIVASSFLIGHLLYTWAKEEVDSVKFKIDFKIMLVFAGIFGVLQGLSANYFEITGLILTGCGIILGSFAKNLKNSAVMSAVFLVLFAIVFSAVNLLV